MATTLTDTGVVYPDSTTQTKGKGTRVLLTTLTASNSASLSFTGFSSSYNNYELIITRIIPVTNSVTARLQFRIADAWASGTYYNAHWQHYSFAIGGSAFRYYGGNQTFIPLSNTGYVYNQGNIDAVVTIWNANSSNYKRLTGTQNGQQYAAAVNARDVFGSTYTGSTGVVQGFQYYLSSGNISSGYIKVYGYN